MKITMTPPLRRALWCLLHLPFGLGLWVQNVAKAQEAPAIHTPPAGAEIVLQLGHSSDGASFVFSPDQRFILSAGGDDTLKLWDIGSGRLLRSFGGRSPSSIDQAVFSPDGRRVLSGGGDGLGLWNVSSGALLLSIGTPQYSLSNHARAVAFSPDGKYLLAGYRDHKVRLWDADTGVLLRTFEGHREDVTSVAFSPDGQFILSAGSRGSAYSDVGILQWDVRTGAIVHQFKIVDDPATSWAYSASRVFMGDAIKVSPDGQYLFAQSLDLKCTIWNFKTGTVLKRFTAAAISPDWHKLATSIRGKGIEVQDADTGRLIGIVVANGLGSISFSPDGRMIGAIGGNYTVELWNVEDGKLVRAFLPKQKPIRAVAFAGDGRRAVTGNDGELQLWDEARLARLLPSDSGIRALAWKADGNAILAGRADRTMGLWDSRSGEMTQRLKLAGIDDVTSVSFGVDSNTVLGANATIAQVFDTRTGSAIRAFDGAFSAAFSGDGQRVVTGGNSVAVWDAGTGDILRNLAVPGPGTRAVAFSPSGNIVASGTDGVSVRLWDSQSGTLVRTLNGHRGNVRVVVFSPDGRSLLSGRFENTIRLWNVENGSLVRELHGHQGWVGGVSFAPDGKRFASVGYDGTMRLWDVDTGRLLITTIVRNGDWLSVTPEGIFATSGDPRDFLAIVRGLDILPMEEFILQNRRDSLGAFFVGKR
jgi:WD40 repeat protein